MLDSRRLTPEDAQALWDLETALVKADEGMVMLPEETTLQRVEKRLARFHKAAPDRALLLGTFEDDALVGTVDLERYPALRLLHTATLTLGVHPEHQGRGLGRRLLREGLSWADTVGVSRVQLYTRADNTRAQRLYRSEGFVEEGVRKALIRDPDGSYVDDLMMARLADNLSAS